MLSLSTHLLSSACKVTSKPPLGLRLSLWVALMWLIGPLSAIGYQIATSGRNLASFVASSPFRMIVQPTDSELDYTALQAVEQASLATLLFAEQQGNMAVVSNVANVEVVIQQVEFLELDQEDLPAITRTQFFALMTTPPGEEDNSSEAIISDGDRRRQLNKLIEKAFSSPSGKEKFLEMLKSNPSTKNISQVTVAPILPTPRTPLNSGSGSSRRKLTSLDIALIVVALAIFLGIVCIVLQRQKEYWYIESLRTLVLSENRNNIDTFNNCVPKKSAECPSIASLSVSSSKKPAEPIETNVRRLPSTPSTVHSDEITPSRPVRITTVLKRPVSNALLSETIANEDTSLAENFDGKWFSSTSLSRQRTNDAVYYHDVDNNDNGGSNQEEGDSWSSSGSSSSTTSSEDVFRVGVENFSSRTNIDEEESKTSSTASSIADWLKQVRVITDVNILNNATEQDALEGVSLEHSMASSSIGVSLPETTVKKVTEV